MMKRLGGVEKSPIDAMRRELEELERHLRFGHASHARDHMNKIAAIYHEISVQVTLLEVQARIEANLENAVEKG